MRHRVSWASEGCRLVSSYPGISYRTVQSYGLEVDNSTASIPEEGADGTETPVETGRVILTTALGVWCSGSASQQNSAPYP